MTPLHTRIRAHFEESIAAQQQAAEVLTETLAEAARSIVDCLMNDGKILICGNGVSASQAQNLAAYLSGRFEQERMELAAIALTGNTAILTASGDSDAFKQIFSQSIRALGRINDILIIICPLGNSANIVEAIRSAHERDMQIIAFTGHNGGQAAASLRDNDILLNVPHPRTIRIQESHTVLLHTLCDSIDAVLLEGL